MTYEALIARKSASTPSVGFDPGELAEHLFPHQRDLVRWALRRGRAAVFADTGLGKAIVLIEWARHVAQRGRVLVLAPLAVGPQIAAEAARFGVEITYVREDTGAPIVVTNYELLHKFDPAQFVGVVLDESSILKAFDGKTRERLFTASQATPYKLCCTATPAPNDFTELGSHSEFLGLKRRSEMLAEYFVHDGETTRDWRIKGHAMRAFWRWVSSWAAVVRLPSDLGHDDGAYVLPPLTMIDHVVETAPDVRAGLTDTITLTGQRAIRRATLAERVARAATLVRQYAADGDQSIVWCDLNDEQDDLQRLLGELCVSIQGSDDEDDKLERHDRWKRGEVPALLTKVKCFGFGVNWQHCRRVIFVGSTHSFEGVYQAVRRCHRFGQLRPVTVDMVRADLESAVSENYQRKERDHAAMGAAMIEIVGDAVRADVRGLAREFNTYEPAVPMIVPQWLEAA